MPLRVAAAPFAFAAGTLLVSVVVEMPAGPLKPVDDGGKEISRVRLSIGFYDRKGRAVGSDDQTIDVSPVPGETSRFVSRIPVAPGVIPVVGRCGGDAEPGERKCDDRHRSARFQSSEALS